ncbi:MAG: hypothetical protein KJ052_15955 [Candidatus Hydrogenedentes bacterium]|nr:hypothetical protein [Candidatus Hydrogenedentota bacterium]
MRVWIMRMLLCVLVTGYGFALAGCSQPEEPVMPDIKSDVSVGEKMVAPPDVPGDTEPEDRGTSPVEAPVDLPAE